MGTQTTVTMAGSAASHLCHSPYIFACCRSDQQTPHSSLGAPWDSCLRPLEPSRPGPRCGADRCAQSCYRVRA